MVKKKWVIVFFRIFLFVYVIYNLYENICFRPYVDNTRSPLYATQPITLNFGFNPYALLSFTFLSYVLTAIIITVFLVLKRENKIIYILKMITLDSTVVCSALLNFSIILGFRIPERVVLYRGNVIFGELILIQNK